MSAVSSQNRQQQHHQKSSSVAARKKCDNKAVKAFEEFCTKHLNLKDGKLSHFEPTSNQKPKHDEKNKTPPTQRSSSITKLNIQAISRTHSTNLSANNKSNNTHERVNISIKTNLPIELKSCGCTYNNFYNELKARNSIKSKTRSSKPTSPFKLSSEAQLKSAKSHQSIDQLLDKLVQATLNNSKTNKIGSKSSLPNLHAEKNVVESSKVKERASSKPPKPSQTQTNTNKKTGPVAESLEHKTEKILEKRILNLDEFLDELIKDIKTGSPIHSMPKKREATLNSEPLLVTSKPPKSLPKKENQKKIGNHIQEAKNTTFLEQLKFNKEENVKEKIRTIEQVPVQREKNSKLIQTKREVVKNSESNLTAILVLPNENDTNKQQKEEEEEKEEEKVAAAYPVTLNNQFKNEFFPRSKPFVYDENLENKDHNAYLKQSAHLNSFLLSDNASFTSVSEIEPSSNEDISNKNPISSSSSSSSFSPQSLSIIKEEKEDEAAENKEEKAQSTSLDSGESKAQKLSLKVYACGISKTTDLPIPKNNFFIEKGHFGDDAAFIAENSLACAIGIADGATGNIQLGYDPGDFSRTLMRFCCENFFDENKPWDARDLLLKAFDDVQEKTKSYGSCTACVLTLDHATNMLSASNIGDSGYCLIRDGRIIYHSEPERITFECPRQLDSYPWKEESRKMGVSYTAIMASETQLDLIDVQKDDLIIVSSDGLYDNMDFEEIESTVQKSKTLMDTAYNLVHKSVENNIKPDDIIVLVAKVVDNKESAHLKKYTAAPSGQ